jgi:ferredoxin-NADP reductase
MSQRLEQLRRDLRAVMNGFAGVKPRPYTTRKDRVSRRGASPFSPRRVQVSKIIRETKDAVTLQLESLDTPVTFEAGQFLTLHVPIEGVVHKRAYSISSAPHDGVLQVTCKRIDGGLVSSHLHGALREGTELEVLGPSGNFVVPADVTRITLIAGGSGITPCWSIARTLVARGADVTLVYGNASEADTIFRKEIDELARTTPSSFRVVHVIGLLTREVLAALETETEFYICGPSAMMDEVRALLRERGVAAARIREERFHTPGAVRAQVGGDERVTIVRKTGRRSLTVPAGRTILEATTQAGIAMPFSCAIGGCAACKCRVLEGEVVMDEPHCLSPAEREAGWVLTCVGRPAGPVTLEIPEC